MSKPVQEIARRLAELRRLTQVKVVEARADHEEYEAAVITVLRLASKYGVENKIGTVPRFQAHVFPRVVLDRALQSAHVLAQQALEEIDQKDPAGEMAIDRLNRDFLEAEGMPSDPYVGIVNGPPAAAPNTEEVSEDRPPTRLSSTDLVSIAGGLLAVGLGTIEQRVRKEQNEEARQQAPVEAESDQSDAPASPGNDPRYPPNGPLF